MLLILVDKHFTLIIMIPGLQRTSWGFSLWEAYDWSSNGNLLMTAPLTALIQSKKKNLTAFEQMKYTNNLIFMKNWELSGHLTLRTYLQNISPFPTVCQKRRTGLRHFFNLYSSDGSLISHAHIGKPLCWAYQCDMTRGWTQRELWRLIRSPQTLKSVQSLVIANK